MEPSQRGSIRNWLLPVICVFVTVSVYIHQLVSLHFSGAVEVIRRPFDSYVRFALVQKDNQIIPYDTCERREVRMTVFTSFMCKQWERRDVNNTLQLLSYYSERMNINIVLFSDNCTFLESVFPNTTVFNIPQVNKFGVPVLRPMFEIVRSHFNSELIMFMNSDILPSYETMRAPMEYYACHPESKTVFFSTIFVSSRIPKPSEILRRSWDPVIFGDETSRDHCSADIFVFPRHANFSQLREVVIGRYCVDNELFHVAHLDHHPVVNMKPLHSIHQGTSSSLDKREAIGEENFFYNCDLRSFNLLGYSMSPDYKAIAIHEGVFKFLRKELWASLQ